MVMVVCCRMCDKKHDKKYEKKKQGEEQAARVAGYPAGWVSVTRRADGHQVWYHPDNPRDVRTKPPLKKKAKSPAAATLAAPLLTSV